MKKAERGFTLLELMVSVGIMVLVLVGSFSVLVEANQMTQQARYRILAANAARSVLETIKDTPLNQVPNINTANFVPRDVNGNITLPNGNIVIRTNPANLAGAQLATVTVRVTWTGVKGIAGNVEVTTMRSRF